MGRVSGVGMLGTAFLTTLLLFPAAAGASSYALDATSAPLSGIVRDSVGNALGEVEVLVLGEPAPAAPVAVARTDERGRFLVAELRPGVYRIAALKEGYLAFLGSVNTFLRPSLDLVLRPIPDANAGKEPAPLDSSWALRLPARSLLRETGPGALMAGDSRDGPAERSSRVAETLDGELAHVVAMAQPLEDGTGEGDVMEGGETRLRLASSIGERAKVAVAGNRWSLGSSSAGGGDPAASRRDSSAIVVDVSYDTSRDANLSVKAGFERRGLLDGTIGARRERTVWGYDALWTRQVDAESRMGVQVGYLDTLLDVGSQPAGASVEVPTPSYVLQNRRIAAEGSFESMAAAGHRLHVDLGARRHDLPASGDPTPLTIVPGDPRTELGWALHLDAGDDWSVSGPVSMIYGLGYERSLDGRRPSLVEPSVGGAWNAAGLRARVVVEYNLVDDSGSSFGTGAVDGFGVEADVEVSLPFGLRLRGGLARDPADAEAAGDAFWSLDSGRDPVFVADGALATGRESLVLEHQSRAVMTWVEWSRGSAEGLLTQMFAIDVPVRLLDDRRMTWREGILGIRVKETGTDVLAEYRRVDDRPAADPSGSEEALWHEYVELRVSQDLVRSASQGLSCRLLLAARAVPRATPAASPGGSISSDRLLAALGPQYSAGLAVAF